MLKKNIYNLLESFFSEEKKPKIVLLSIPILILIYIYHGSEFAFVRYFSRFSCLYYYAFYRVLYNFLATFIIFFLIPLLIIKVILRENPLNFGLTTGQWKYGLRFVIITIPLVITPIIWFGSQIAQVRAYYPLCKMASTGALLFIVYELSYVLLYYIGWEFFFRGYILFGLQEKFGDTYAILIQLIPSAILHFNRPEVEFFGSIVLGIILGYLALRTRSILYPLMIHCYIGVSTDLFVSLLS